MPNQMKALVVAVVVLAIAGCRDDENKRLAEQAERNLDRQAAQELRNTELHREVAEGTKRLVEADADAREEMVGLHRDVQSERSELGRQRDQLENERREIANARYRDPLIAESIKAVGLMLVCAVPLLIAWQVLRGSDQADENAAMAKLFLDDITSPAPKLISVRVQADSDDSGQLRSINDKRPDRRDCN